MDSTDISMNIVADVHKKCIPVVLTVKLIENVMTLCVDLDF